MTASMPYRGENRRLSIGEEVLNAVTHGLGALLGVVGTIILICHARAIGGRLNLVSVTVFGVSMILLYLISCLYHALPRSRGKAVFQVLDHCSIFLLIVGTYTKKYSCVPLSSFHVISLCSAICVPQIFLIFHDPLLRIVLTTPQITICLCSGSKRLCCDQLSDLFFCIPACFNLFNC